MLSIINMIISASGYIKEDAFSFPGSFLYSKEQANKDEFFIISDISDKLTTDIDDFQTELHSAMSDFFSKNEGAEKNTNLILLKNANLPTDRLTQNIINRKISDVEENPFYFKKNFIFYSDDELTSISNILISSSPLDVVKSLSAIMHDYTRFINFRDYDNDILFRVVSKLYTKLPFLTYNLKQSDLICLSSTIKNILIDKLLLERSQQLIRIDLSDLSATNAWMKSIEEEDNDDYV